MANAFPPQAQHRLFGLNYALGKIYRTETRISTLLMSLGFSENQVQKLQHEHLEESVSTVSLCLEHICLEFVGGNSDHRIAQISIRRFCLHGDQQSTLQDIGQDWGLSRERIRQLEEKTLGRIRKQPWRDKFYDRTITGISSLVGQPESTPKSLTIKPPEPTTYKKYPGIKPESVIMEFSEENVRLAVKWILERLTESTTMQMILLVLIGSHGPKTRILVETFGLHRVYGVLREYDDNSTLYKMLWSIYKNNAEMQQKIAITSMQNQRYVIGNQQLDDN